MPPITGNMTREGMIYEILRIIKKKRRKTKSRTVKKALSELIETIMRQYIDNEDFDQLYTEFFRHRLIDRGRKNA